MRSIESAGGVGTDIRSMTPFGIGTRSSGIEHTPEDAATVTLAPGSTSLGDTNPRFHSLCGAGAAGWSQSSRCGNFWKASRSAGRGGEVCASKAHGSRARIQMRMKDS
jgi:hypothetical protein